MNSVMSILIASLITYFVSSSLLTTLNTPALLEYAKLCSRVYDIGDTPCTNDQMTDILREEGLIQPLDKIVLQGFRNEGQLNSIIIKQNSADEDSLGINRFRVAFVGTDTIKDGILDVQIGAVNEQLEKLYTESISSKILTRIKKKFRNDSADIVIDDIRVHSGFKKANKEFLLRLFENLGPYIKTQHAIFIEITGHSMGGALASHMAYHVMKRLAKQLGIPSEFVKIKVVTFGAAGFFLEQDLGKVSRITDSPNTMAHFYRPNDVARELTDMAGYKNPGNWIFLDNFVQADSTLEQYLLKVLGMQEGIPSVAYRIMGELENHYIRNYIKTIEYAMTKGQELADATSMVVKDDERPDSTSPIVYYGIFLLLATFIAYLIPKTSGTDHHD